LERVEKRALLKAAEDAGFEVIVTGRLPVLTVWARA
jgi:hypothetical protein